MNNSKDPVARFFDADSADYLRHQYSQGMDSFMALRRERAARLIRTHLAPLLDVSFRFLDAGCGPGVLLEVLGRQPIQYVGIDISAQMLALARREAAQCVAGFRGEFLQADVERLPFPAGSFDAVAAASHMGAAGIMLDTADKHAGSLLTHLDPSGIDGFVAHAKAQGLKAGLAGSLTGADVPKLLTLSPDLLGFRGALCRGQRSASLDPASCASIRALIPRIGSPAETKPSATMTEAAAQALC